MLFFVASGMASTQNTQHTIHSLNFLITAVKNVFIHSPMWVTDSSCYKASSRSRAYDVRRRNEPKKEREKWTKLCVFFRLRRSTIEIIIISNFLNAFLSSFVNLLNVSLLFFQSGTIFKAHKLILAACSKNFADLFETPSLATGSVCVILEATSAENMAALLEFMYKGEVHVSQKALESFLKAAESLQVRLEVFKFSECMVWQSDYLPKGERINNWTRSLHDKPNQQLSSRESTCWSSAEEVASELRQLGSYHKERNQTRNRLDNAGRYNELYR